MGSTDRADGFDALGESLVARTAVLAFRDAGEDVSSLADVRALGGHLTTAVKCAKRRTGSPRRPWPRANGAGDDITLFVGYLDGRPVATAGACTGHGVNAVEWVATHPSARGRGIGAALTWTASTVRPEAPAVLIASDDGQPVYARLGYVRLLRLTMWHRPPLGPP